MGKSRFAEDPVERFARVALAASGSNPGLSEDALGAVMAGKPDDDAKTDAAATQIAANSALTKAQAKAVIAPKIKAAADSKAKAKDASEAATAAAASATADIELSDPVMLKPAARVVVAVVQAAIVGLAAVLLALKGMSNDRAIGLSVVAVLNSIGILVLVMGYKNVTLKASPPTKASS